MEWNFKLGNLRRGTPLKAVQVFVGETVELKNDMPKVEYNKPLTGNIQDTLKELIQKEIKSLPDTLKEMEA